jgi:anthranilate/para-aminobenzoate synthase component II
VSASACRCWLAPAEEGASRACAGSTATSAGSTAGGAFAAHGLERRFALERGGLFDGLESDSRFYFLHSYYFKADRPADVLATAEYGVKFACAVRSGHIFGVQFHPEKSHRFGMRLLQNFAVLH